MRNVFRPFLPLAALACLGFDGDFCNSSPSEGNPGPPDPSFTDAEIAPEYIRTDYRVTYFSPGFSRVDARGDQTFATMELAIEGHPDISSSSDLNPETPPTFANGTMYQPPFAKPWRREMEGRIDGSTFEYRMPDGAVYRNTTPAFPSIAPPAVDSIVGGRPFELYWEGPPLGELERIELRLGGLTETTIAMTDTVGAVSITIPADQLQDESIELFLVRSATYPLQAGPAGGSLEIATYSDVLEVPIAR